MGTSLQSANLDVVHSIHVQGHVSGQIANGDYITQINEVHGDVVLRAPPHRPAPRPRRVPILLRPRSFPGLLDRRTESDVAVAALREGWPVEIHGVDGAGKTSLVRSLAYGPGSELFRDGVVYLDVADLPVSDALLSLFDAFYERDPEFKPTGTQIIVALQHLQALIFLDDVDLNRGEVDALMDAAPTCTFVIAAPRRILSHESRSIGLAGLPADEAVMLLERELGRPLTNGERNAASELCTALGGHPLRLLQAAGLSRDTDRPLAELARLAAVGPSTAIVDTLLPGLSEAERRVLAVLSAIGVPVDSAHVAAIAGIPDAVPALGDLERRHLVRRASPYRSTGTAGATWQGLDLDAVRARATEYFVGWARDNARAPRRIAVDAEPLVALLRWASETGRWPEAIRLGRAVDGALTAGGRWGMSIRVLSAVHRAARSAGDRASEAWALHQLGTRALCLGEIAGARAQLGEALRIRVELGDRLSAAVTRHNLSFLVPPAGAPPHSSPSRPPHPPPPSTHPFRLPMPVIVILALVATLTVGTGFYALGDDNPTPTPTKTRTKTRTPTPKRATRTPTNAGGGSTGSGNQPTDTPVRPTDTPQVPTDTPSVPTDTPTSPPQLACAAGLGVPVVTYQEAVTTAPDVNLRSGPAAECDPIEVLAEGTILRVLSEPLSNDEGEWLRVRALDSGSAGWIRADLVGAHDPETQDTQPPDLVVSQCFTSEDAAAVFVRNLGQGPAGPTTTLLVSAGNTVAALPTKALAPGEETRLDEDALSGGGPLTAVADGNGEANEANEANNRLDCIGEPG